MRKHLIFAAAAAAVALATPAAKADAVADFYKNKQLRILIGYGAGGGYDTVTRLVGKHLSKHIPGNPTIVPQNMPGAGSMKVANYLFNAAPKDGTTLGVFAASTALEPLFGNDKAKYDPRKFAWIGSMHQDTASLGIWNGGGQNIKTLDDILEMKKKGTLKEIIFGSTSPAAITSQHPLVLKNYFDLPIKIIYGYKGTKGVSLAMQRGEVVAMGGMFESSVKGAFRNHVEAGNLKVFVQFGPDKSVPYFKDATRIYDRLKSPKDRQVMDVIFRQTQLARPLAAPPGTPADRVAALRKAMLATIADPELLKDAKKSKIEFAPLSGDETQALLDKFYVTPPALIKQAMALIGRK
ncbi:MAG: tripartite tricarboxylate transporter substrate-binding protein [Alphaproteobacteria bacterium]|jgi:tripartite-type tricarboxylate transporter receptor subunit TctC